MPSVVASAFRDEIVASVSEGRAELLDAARGTGPEHRETNRALMLGDRAAREWAASAVAVRRSGASNRLEELPLLGKPEDAYHDLEPAARAERKAASSPAERDVADAVVALADALQQIDTEAGPERNQVQFEAVGRAAADVLIEAGELLGSDDFVLEHANRALSDLVALSGWQNQLGPRFE